MVSILKVEVIMKDCIRIGSSFATSMILIVLLSGISGSGGFSSVSSMFENASVIGPVSDTLLIVEDFVHEGNLFVTGNGVIIVDGAELTLYGHLYQKDNGKVILRNGAYLHVPQRFNSQYLHLLHDNSSFLSEGSTVFANTVYRIRHFDNSEYVARQTVFPHWNFHEVYDGSRLLIEDANIVGDLTIRDSCEIVFVRCDTILPWLGVGSGESVDLRFPDFHFVDYFEFSSDLPGVNGIDYSVVFDSCGTVAWGLESRPGSSIHVHDTNILSLVFRIVESDTVENITDYTAYNRLSFPFDDRQCILENVYLHLWLPYTYGETVLYLDSCRYGESIAKDRSRITATGCIADGFPSSASAIGSGSFTFRDGICRTCCSSWDNATLLLENVRVEPRRRTSQNTNLAHGNSRFLAVNSTFEYEPEALDSALVIVAAMNELSVAEAGMNVVIPGSAWIDTGPFRRDGFDRYEVRWSVEGESSWNLIGESSEQKHGGVLAVWETAGLDDGEYSLRLTVRTDSGESLSAYVTVTLRPMATLIHGDTLQSFAACDPPTPAPQDSASTLHGSTILFLHGQPLQCRDPLTGYLVPMQREEN